MSRLLTRVFLLFAAMVMITSAYPRGYFQERDNNLDEPMFSVRDILDALINTQMARRGEPNTDPKRTVCSTRMIIIINYLKCFHFLGWIFL